MIGLIDYNMGNLQSVKNAFESLNVKVELVRNAKDIGKCEKVILPGVGAYKDAMACLKERNMIGAIQDFSKTDKPLLGICLGMQLLFESSEEFGSTEGLGLIDGRIERFNLALFDHPLKVPHMGWNVLRQKQNSPLFKGMPDSFYLYFVHSFHAVCKDEYIVGETMYGYNFPSAVQKGNIFGFQPHPEKSHSNGLLILKNFVEL